MTAGRHRQLLCGVLLLALLLRLGWGLSRSSEETALADMPDQLEYLQYGRSLLAGRYVMIDPRYDGEVLAFRPPGYPLLVAACGALPPVVRTVQALLDVSTVLAVYLLARRWLSAGAALAAALLVTLNPLLIYFSGMLLSETLFTALLAWGLWLVTGVGRRALLGGALLLALAVLVRPSAVALPVVLSAGAAVALGQGHRRPVAALAALLTLAALAPWVARNWMVLGTPVWSSTNAGFTLYDGLNPHATGGSDLSHLRHVPELRRMPELDRDRHLAALAWDYARAHPQRAWELAGHKALRMWSPVPMSDAFSARPLYVAAGAIGSGGLMLLAVLGLWKGRPGVAVKLLLLAPALYFTIAHAVTVGSMRYRAPCEAPMAVLAASGLAALGRRDAR